MHETILCAACTASVPDAPTCPKCGQPTALHGRFTLLEEVGSGAFGTTYRAREDATGREVAIKEMLTRRADSLKHLELFAREAQVLERLSHPGVPRYHEDFVIEAGRSSAFCLVQEFIEGDTLEARELGRPIAPARAFELGVQLLDILRYLHAFSPAVVHRDIKPSNVMVRPDGQLVLIDFGTVKAALDDGAGSSTVAGTFGYMAPEQFLGRALPETDIYGVGATLVALLSGGDPQRLIGADRTIDLSRLRLETRWTAPLARLLATDPRQRPSAAEAQRLLRDAIANRNQPPAIAPEGNHWSTPHEARAQATKVVRGTSVAIVGGMVAILMMGGVIVAVTHMQGASEEAVSKVATAVHERMAATPEPAASNRPEPTQQVEQARLLGPNVPTLGPADAPVTLVVFSNYECVHCTRLWRAALAAQADHPERLRLAFRHYPFRPLARELALKAICAEEQGAFWAFHTRLHEIEAKHTLRGVTTASLVEGLDLDPAALDRCAASDKARERLEADLALVEALGISGVPQSYLNGKHVAGSNIELELRHALQAASP